MLSPELKRPSKDLSSSLSSYFHCLHPTAAVPLFQKHFPHMTSACIFQMWMFNECYLFLLLFFLLYSERQCCENEYLTSSIQSIPFTCKSLDLVYYVHDCSCLSHQACFESSKWLESHFTTKKRRMLREQYPDFTQLYLIRHSHRQRKTWKMKNQKINGLKYLKTFTFLDFLGYHQRVLTWQNHS